MLRQNSLARLRFDTLVLLNAAIYVRPAPTWLSAMTGYIVPSKPLAQFGTTFLDISRIDWTFPVYLIADGHRVDTVDNACFSNLLGADSTRKIAYVASIADCKPPSRQTSREKGYRLY